MNTLKLEMVGLMGADGRLPDVERFEIASLRHKQWDWDRVVKGTHPTNCWYSKCCNYNLYAKDGIVLREEVAGNYPPRGEAPDFNPRGCQKGACYVHRMYDPTRVKYPLKRVGPRGAARWQRVSWEQAFDEIAGFLFDVLVRDGPDGVHEGRGSQWSRSNTFAASSLFDVLDVPRIDVSSEEGDDHQGAAVTFGKAVFAQSADNWFYADLILMWGANPAYTHIPNFHFIAEARYNGTKVIAIAPDYNASSIHADLWVPIRVGTDAALALSIAQVILEEKLYNVAFICEQTDLPFLVREDTGKFLRESDLRRGGREECFYLYDLKSREIREAPWKSLSLNGLEPALQGAYEVQTLQGPVKARPVLALLKEQLGKAYAPDQASDITGVSAAVIRRLAREIASARGVVNVDTAVWGKFYHGDAMERAIILAVALCGQLGRKGAVYSAFASIAPDTSLGAFQRLGSQIMLNVASADPRYSRWREQGYTDEMILSEYVRESFAQKSMVPSSLIYLVHGGILKELDRHNNWDPSLRRPLREYAEESNSRGWYHLPDAERPPRLVFVHGGNMFRRVRSSHLLLENFLPKIELLVTLDIRMSTTALFSDFVLPTASYYETDSIPWLAVPLAPYLNISVKAAEPLSESKSEWEIYCRLAQRLQEKALEKGIATYRDRQGRERRFDRVVEQLTSGGLYDFDDDEAIARDAFLHTENVEKLDWEVFKERGIAEFTGPGRHIRSISNACDIRVGEPVVPLTWHTDGKEPYPTLTRRIQFYIDHDWYLELGEALPAHKDSPPAGGDYPLHLNGGHARWSIHSNWVDNPLLLQLQRGEPAAFMNPHDAGRRGIRDGDWVEVYNDVGRFQIRALLSAAVRPDEAIIYHSWDNFQFSGWRHFKNVMPSPVNPLEFAGGYFQLRPLALTLAPGMSDRDTRVEIRPLGP